MSVPPPSKLTRPLRELVTAALTAIDSQDDEGFRTLLPRLKQERLVDYIRADPLARTMLNFALEKDSARIANLLLRAGADPNVPDYRGKTPLMKSVFNESLSRALLNAGADIDATDDYLKTALHYAGQSIRATPKLVRLLLTAGADPNARDSAGRTPLHDAASGADPTKVKLLIEAGSRVTAATGRIGTPAENIAPLVAQATGDKLVRLRRIVSMLRAAEKAS